MSAHLEAALEAKAIFLRRYRPGEHRAPCPECDKGSRDDALAIRLDARGATCLCHRCGLAGGIRDGGVPERAPRSRGQHQGHERLRTLAPWGHRLWTACRPITPGTVAAVYLERRGCAMPHLDGDLRWHPDLLDRVSGYRGPALAALVTHAVTAEPLTLHRTWLAPDGSGKAPLEKPRLLLAKHSKSGGVVRLWPDEEVTLGLAIAEGLESALAAARVFVPIWSTLDASNMAAFPVLAGIEALTIFADHDAPDRLGRQRGIEAAHECASRWTAAGREVWLDVPPTPGTDFNDVATGACG
jgi:putative DNA primase/helicase